MGKKEKKHRKKKKEEVIWRRFLERELGRGRGDFLFSGNGDFGLSMVNESELGIEEKFAKKKLRELEREI